MAALDAIEDWPVPTVAAAVVGPSGILAQHGDVRHRFELASVTKPLVARAAQVAVEEGAVELDTQAGPPGSTVRHLLAHAVGVLDALGGPDGPARQAPGLFELRLRGAGGDDPAASGIEFGRYLTEAICEPLRHVGHHAGRAGPRRQALAPTSTVADLVAFAGDLLRPSTVSQQMHSEATDVQFPGLSGVLPGFGTQRPNDWGLGFEIRDGKSPHWTGSANSGRTYGHFGQSGTFLWVDPQAELALVALADRNFGDWAYSRWPALSDEVLREFGAD